MEADSVQIAKTGAKEAASTHRLSRIEISIMLGASVLIPAMSYLRWWSISVTESCGFVTGGVCVWLVVREHLWNWPAGLANNVLFFVLFFQARLYADMALQAIYFGLGVYGWWNWLHGGVARSPIGISRTTRREWLSLIIAVPMGTWIVREVLLWANGAAPFADSLTTVLSLSALYLLCQKRIENWWFWILADLIYMPLYVSRGLPLTAALYAIFLVMCICGMRRWSKKFLEGEQK